VQQLMYDDPKDLSKAIMVFRPNGGANIRNQLDRSITFWLMSSARKISVRPHWMLFSVSLITSRTIQSVIAVSAISRIWAASRRRY
jgi:hypothetical protein